MVKYAFILSDSFAITVEPFVVLDSRTGDENGARIQIRRVQDGAEPATQLGEPIWRGDLFKLTDGSPGNWDRAHYHPRFHGLQAGERNAGERRGVARLPRGGAALLLPAPPGGRASHRAAQSVFLPIARLPPSNDLAAAVVH